MARSGKNSNDSMKLAVSKKNKLFIYFLTSIPIIYLVIVFDILNAATKADLFVLSIFPVEKTMQDRRYLIPIPRIITNVYIRTLAKDKLIRDSSNGLEMSSIRTIVNIAMFSGDQTPVVINNEIALIKYLIDSGYDLNKVDNLGCTALDYALSYETHQLLVDYLVDNGAKRSDVCR